MAGGSFWQTMAALGADSEDEVPNTLSLMAGVASVHDSASGKLIGVPDTAVARWTPIEALCGCEAQLTRLAANTAAFAAGRAANDALLWGARGTGKSAAVKAVLASVGRTAPSLRVIETDAANAVGVRRLVMALADTSYQVVLFVDDLGADAEDPRLRALPPVLDGGLFGRPQNVIVYATSNRRHLAARPNDLDLSDVHDRDTMEDTLALSDRFGLSLAFHPLGQSDFLAAVDAHARLAGVPVDADLHRRALEWSSGRGARTGRTARQFIVALLSEV
jgi:predicted AAA+ superfamily ATPase